MAKKTLIAIVGLLLLTFYRKVMAKEAQASTLSLSPLKFTADSEGRAKGVHELSMAPELQKGRIG